MNILLVCACGSSTSVVLQKMKENLASDEPWTIEAKSLSDAKKVMGKCRPAALSCEGACL